MPKLLEHIEMTQEEFEEGCQAYEGRCLSCGDNQFGCEGDASNYPCESCGEEEVFGLEELLILGKIVITG